MKTTGQLAHDHKAILRAVDILRTMGQRAGRREGFDVADGQAMIHFFRTFADRCHHHKEETVLFPTLIERGLMKGGGPVGVMLSEHEEGRELLGDLESAVTQSNSEMFSWFAAQYARLLTDHIFKEDNILFPMADQMLSGADDATILREFERIEEEMGAETHERFHRLLDEMGRKYVKTAA